MKYLKWLGQSLIVTSLLLVGCKAQSPTLKEKSTPSAPMVEMSAGDPNAIVAKIAGQPVKDADIRNESQIKMELYQAEQQFYESERKKHEAYRGAVERYVETQLIEQAAKKAGLSVDDYLKKEVDDKVKKPDDAAIKAFYDERKINRPFDTIKDRISEFLETQAKTELRTALVEGLKSSNNVEILVADFNKPKPLPPKVEVPLASDEVFRGNKEANVTIVVFSDYECPYCSRSEETINEVLKKYEGKVRLAFRHFPLPFHQNAKGAHVAAECAKDQGKFWEYHDKLFANQKQLRTENLIGYADDLKLDQSKFKECLKDEKYASKIDDHLEIGRARGVSGTPAFFINGRMLSGARPFAAFAEIIDAELKGS